MPRFSLKELFVAVTLISLGVGGLCWLFTPHELRWESPIPFLFLYFWSAICIGAGIGTLFRHKAKGAIVSIFAFVLLSPILLSETIGDGHFNVSLFVHSSSQPIKSVYCLSTSEERVVDFLLSKLELPKPDRWSLIRDRFDGTPISLDVWFSDHENFFHHTTIHEKWIVVVTEFHDGTRAGKLVEIPDGPGPRSVTVELP